MLSAKDKEYYRGIRDDITGLVDKSAKRVLDIGCASGVTGRSLKESGIDEVVGVEYDRDACREASSVLDKVFCADIQKLTLPYEDGYFDCIIYADVLEHLMDPWDVLKKNRKFLSDSGVVIASIPNIQHYRVIKKLKAGRWDYEDKGVLDSAHIRFFTLSSAKKMFAEAGYAIDEIIYKVSASKVKKFLNNMLGGRMNSSLSEQFLIRARKA
jgi:2-polyprenyl-3-methyl-5-hydroxy-6-metoxy-1,4-benzoquinol methylase